VHQTTEFKLLLDTTGSTARELFEDRVEALQEGFEKLKPAVRDLFKDHGKVITVETTYEEFTPILEEAIKKEGSGAPEIRGEHEKRALHSHLLDRAKKKVRRKEEDYEDLLFDKDFSISKVTWEDAQPRLAKHTAYKDLTEERAKELFEDWLEKEKEHRAKKRKHSDSGSGGEEGEVSAGEDGERKKAKKEKKKDKKSKKSKKTRSEDRGD